MVYVFPPPVGRTIIVLYCLKRFVIFNLKTCEKLPGIAATAVIGGQHFKRHGLSETPGSGDTNILIVCIHHFICTRNQIRLVHIYLGANRFPEALVARIQVNSHRAPPLLHSPCLVL